MLESAGVEVLESAAGVVVSGAVALASAGVDPVVLESVAAGVVVSTGVVLAVVLVVLASVVEPATMVSLEPDSMTVALLLAKSTCAPSFTVLSVPTSSPVEAKNLFKAMALRSGVRINPTVAGRGVHAVNKTFDARAIRDVCPQETGFARRGWHFDGLQICTARADLEAGDGLAGLTRFCCEQLERDTAGRLGLCRCDARGEKGCE